VAGKKRLASLFFFFFSAFQILGLGEERFTKVSVDSLPRCFDCFALFSGDLFPDPPDSFFHLFFSLLLVWIVKYGCIIKFSRFFIVVKKEHSHSCQFYRYTKLKKE